MGSTAVNNISLWHMIIIQVQLENEKSVIINERYFIGYYKIITKRFQ